MKIDRVSLERKFNLGNYETLDVGLEAMLGEKDNPLDVWKQLEDLAELYLQARTAKPETKPASAEAPKLAVAPKPVVTPPTSPPQVPFFNSEELMRHKWKGKKTGEGSYAEGSLGWGWDFRDKFSAEVIAVLEKGPLQIGDYEFTVSEVLVSSKKKKA